MIERYKKLIEDTIAELERIAEGNLVGIVPGVHSIVKEARRRLTLIEQVSDVDRAVVDEYEEKVDERPEQAVQLYRAGSSLVEVSAIVKSDPTTIRKWLVDRGVKIRSKGPVRGQYNARDRERVERIRKMREEGKTLREMGIELKVTRERVRQIMIRAGIPTEQVLRSDQMAAVKDYVDGVESLRMVATRHDTDMLTLRRWLERAGYDLKPNEKKQKRDSSEQTKERAARAAELYKAGMKTEDIARELGVSSGAAVYRYLDLAQVPRNRRVAKVRPKVHVVERGPEMPWTSDRVQLLKDMWGEGKTAKQIAEALGGITRNSVIGKIGRLGLQRKNTQVVKTVNKTSTPPKVLDLTSYWVS